MIYPDDFEIRLSFDRIREMIERKCVTMLAKEKLANMCFYDSFDKVKRVLSETFEMKTILMMEDDFPLGGYVDITYFLKKVKVEGSYLDTLELNQLTTGLKVAEELLKFFNSREPEKYPYLNRLTEGVVIIKEVINRIESIIDKYSKIKDSASPGLYSVRQQLRDKEGQVSRRLQTILRNAQSSGIVEEDAQITIRDGRAVVPVVAANKRKIKGFVHDESATGKTVYIEPIEVVELNNEIKELEYSERREIIKILIDFSDFIRPYASELLTAGDFIATIDFIKAKANIASEMNADMPILSHNVNIDLVNARHPLLEQTLKRDQKPIVPLTLKLTPEKHILVISGPNAGGKSVCLKTVGLLQYMMQTGLLIPASPNSTMGIFEKIFIDIGDQQSIDNDLSTYSSHLTNMKNILKNAGNTSLVLIDEFGTGTEPAMGGAIAETILQKIEEKGVFGVITTHYSNIKYYASTAHGIINGAMSFDVQNIRPLFGLEIGKPGSSFAFEIARKTGLPEEIVKEAQTKIGSSQINIEKQLREIARDKRYWETKRDKIRVAEKKTDTLAEKYEQELSTMRDERKRIISEAKEEAKRIVFEANRIIENTVREIKESQAEKEKTKLARQRVEEFKEDIISSDANEMNDDIQRKIELLKQREARRMERKAQRGELSDKVAEPTVIKPKKTIIELGDKVRIKGQVVAGEVIKIESNRATVVFGHLSTQVELKRLEIISNAEYKKQQKDPQASATNIISTPTISQKGYDPFEKRLNFSQQIDVRGMRVDEALKSVQEFIDEAIMLGIPDVKILHGKGTGALKEEIRKQLNSIDLVISARDEHVQFGGAGITVVRLDV